MIDRMHGPRVVAMLLLGLSATACSDSATEPGTDDFNPALLDPGPGVGMVSGMEQGLPQGAAKLPGPGGITMDATAEEFVQSLRLRDGQTLRTSGIVVRAVPALSESNPPIARMSVSVAMTGSLTTPGPGTYSLMAESPDINFIDEVFASGGWIWETVDASRVWASSGSITIASVNYFPDIHECTLQSASTLVIEQCRDQLGVISGAVEMRATLNSGEVVLEPTDFTLPIRRRTIVASQR